jgi:hypothetical protein
MQIMNPRLPGTITSFFWASYELAKSGTCQKKLCSIHDILHWVGIIGVQVSSDDVKTVAYPVSYHFGEPVQEECIPLMSASFLLEMSGTDIFTNFLWYSPSSS